MNKTYKYEEIIENEGKLVWKVRGISMLPLIKQDKDVIVIKKIDKSLKKYDIVLFKRDKQDKVDYVLHRIMSINDDTYFIMGDNCLDGEYVSRKQIIGILTDIIRDNKHIKLEGITYRLYLFFICDLSALRIFNTKVIIKIKRVIKRILHI